MRPSMPNNVSCSFIYRHEGIFNPAAFIKAISVDAIAAIVDAHFPELFVKQPQNTHCSFIDKPQPPVITTHYCDAH